MKSSERLYEAFGELIYVVAMADGNIQKEELQTIENRLAGHPWGKDIKWSFDYEVKKSKPIDELYKNVLSYCEMHGPDKEYTFLMETLEEVAKASAGKIESEEEVIDDFTADLCKKFREDIERINAENA